MKILHYALGFPPYRSGGMTKFCVDLMVQQSREGHSVAMLWPGKMSFVNKITAVNRKENVKIKEQMIQSFEIINPLPVSLDEGIASFAAFTKDNGKSAYKGFLNEFQPDVIHIHTLMGLHKSFLIESKARGIRLVFTAHDFFPICPKVTLFRHGTICNTFHTCADCGECNITALDLKKIIILQSPLYRKFKNSQIVKKLRKQHRDDYLSESIGNGAVKKVGTPSDYKNLRAYYYSLLKLMDIIHYNSSITKKIYESVFELPNNCIVSITHSDIKDNRRIRKYSDNILRIRYLGPQSGAKGYLLLKSALDELWGEKKNFCLDIHFIPSESAPYIKIHERYSYSELEDIFDDTDILIAPSIWYETFGFTVLEALSFGVPVVISGTVGSKDILVEGAGIIVENITPKKLCKTLQDITQEKLRKMNQTIVEKQKIVKIDDMSRQIEKKCYGWQF